MRQAERKAQREPPQRGAEAQRLRHPRTARNAQRGAQRLREASPAEGQRGGESRPEAPQRGETARKAPPKEYDFSIDCIKP